MVSLTSTLFFTPVSENRRFRCISFCVSRALSPSCEQYRYRCGHECARFKYSGCNATHMKVWDMVKLIMLHACVHRIPFRNWVVRGECRHKFDLLTCAVQAALGALLSPAAPWAAHLQFIKLSGWCLLTILHMWVKATVLEEGARGPSGCPGTL